MGKLWELIKMILKFFGIGESEGSPTVPPQVSESPEEEENNNMDKPKKYALLVGLNKYALPNADLNGCVNDVNAMWEILVNRYGFEADNIRTLIDERATKQAILERIHWLTSVAKDGDILLYHHSGHGSHLRDRSGDELLDYEDECLISYDHDWDNPLLDDEIGEAFKKIPQGARLVFICDTCLSGNTKIPLLDGTEKTIREMQEEGGEYWVYSSKENGEVVPGKAHSARIMGKKKLIRINLDNGEHLECTDDHLIMMRDGSYKQAGELKQGDSLMPLYRREWEETDSNYLKGYEFIRTTNPDSNRRKWIPTHIMVRDSFDMKQPDSGETVCHHEDCEFCCPNNHKVVSVEQTDKVELVYDLTVDEYHNFAISSGIFVHNCHSGTMNRSVSEEPLKSRYYPAPLDIEFRSRDRNLQKSKLGWVGTTKAVNDITRVEGQRHMLLSGCRDNQTSADAVFGGTWRGALTYTMMSIMQKYPKASWVDLHEHLIEQLKAKGFSQIPQLSGPSDLLDKSPFSGVMEE